METVQKYLRVDRREISFLKFIIEAYDGVALLRTIDSETGIVVLHVSPGCENEIEAVITELKKEIMLENIGTKELYNTNLA